MINLLPPKDRLNIERSKRNSILKQYIELCLAASLLLALLVAGSYFALQRQNENARKTAQINAVKIAELEGVQEDAKQLAASINTISALLSRDIKFSTMLTDIAKLTPRNSVLTGLEIASTDSKAPLIISAQVDSEQTAAVLRNNLANSALFESANIKSIVRNGEETNSGGTGTTDDSSSEDEEAAEESRYTYTTVIDAYFKQGKKND